VSNTRAIEAVTVTLRNLLAAGVTDLPNQNVTTRPLDKVRGGNTTPDQLNLFMFQTALSGAWRNMDVPRQSGAGDIGPPPLALNLHYIVTAFGQGDDETRSHRWLGGAMRVLHDHPVLGAAEIRNASVESGLEAQVERVRITPQPMSLEEISKLWTTFQTQYRTSVAYQVEVVLIESRRTARVPVPVLRRGKGPLEGVTAVAGATLPVLEGVRLPHAQSSALLGDEIVVEGRNLGGASAVRMTAMSPGLPAAAVFSLVPSAATDSELRVTLPDDAAARRAWIAGFYSLSAIVNRDSQEWSSNALPLSLAPRIEAVAPPSPVARDGNQDVTLTITCSPEMRLAPVDAQHMRFAQQVVLLVDAGRHVAPQSPPAPPPAPAPPPVSTNTLVFQFHVDANEVGEHLIRVRVDGVDMPVVDRLVTPPQFDARQKVTFA
jgi:hypothetical protein